MTCLGVWEIERNYEGNWQIWSKLKEVGVPKISNIKNYKLLFALKYIYLPSSSCLNIFCLNCLLWRALTTHSSSWYGANFLTETNCPRTLSGAVNISSVVKPQAVASTDLYLNLVFCPPVVKII